MRLTDEGEPIPNADLDTAEAHAVDAARRAAIVRAFDLQRARLLRRAWRRGVWTTRETLTSAVCRTLDDAAARVVWSMLRGDVIARRVTWTRRMLPVTLMRVDRALALVSLAADIRRALSHGRGA